MNDANHQLEVDILDRATAALRNTAASESPPPRVVKATIEALNSRFGQTETGSPKILRRESERRQRMFRIARYSSLAAALLLMVVGASVALFIDRGASTAFGQVIDNIKKATSVSVTSKQKRVIADAVGRISEQPTIELTFYLGGDFMRMEMPGKQETGDAKIPLLMAIVIDGKTKDVVQVDYANKTAQKFKLDDKRAKQFNNPVEELTKLTGKDAELVGDEDLGGRKTRLYRLKDLHGAFGIVDKVDDGKLWVDRETGLPAKLAIQTNNSPDGKMKITTSITIDDFKWNEHFKEDFFKLTIPEGFKVSEGNAGANLEKTSEASAAPFPFSLVVDNVKKATSVTCTIKSGFGSMPKMEIKYYVQGDLMRMEIPGKQEGHDAKMPFTQVVVFDLGAKKSAAIDFVSKTFTTVSMAGRPDEQMADPIDTLVHLADKDVERIDAEMLHGRKTRAYKLLRVDVGGEQHTLKEDERAKLWVDAESGLPVRLEAELLPPGGDGKTKSSVAMEDLQWNKPLDPGLFKLEAPEGFKVIDGNMQPDGADRSEPSK